MKNSRKLVLFTSIALLVLLIGCGRNDVKINTPAQAIIFTENINEEYDCVQLEANGKKYIPYCAASVSMCEEVIGYYDITAQEQTEDGRIFILSCKDLSSDEWIIDCAGNEGEVVNGHNIGMLMKEESVTDIPENLQGKSEYEWNQ